MDRDSPLLLKGLQDHLEWMNQKDEFQRTALMRASYYVDVFNALVQQGGDLNVQGADPEILNHDRKRVLHLAKEEDHDTVVSDLEAYMEADVSSRALSQVIHSPEKNSRFIRSKEKEKYLSSKDTRL